MYCVAATTISNKGSIAISDRSRTILLVYLGRQSRVSCVRIWLWVYERRRVWWWLDKAFLGFSVGAFARFESSSLCGKVLADDLYKSIEYNDLYQ